MVQTSDLLSDSAKTSSQTSTVLELSTSVKAFVKNIDYISQMAAFHGKSGNSNSIYPLPLSDSTKPNTFMTIPFSIVRQKQFQDFLISIVLAAVATQFMLFLRMMTSTTCPYYHVQRCIAFHQFHLLYGVLILFNWHGPDRSADAVKWKARTVDKGTYCIISTQFPLL